MSGATHDGPQVIGKDEELGVEDILINPTPKGMTEEEAAALLGQDETQVAVGLLRHCQPAR